MKQYIISSIILIAFTVALQAQEPQYEEVDLSLTQTEEEVNVLFGTQKYGRFVGNSSVVKGENLQNYPAMMINEALVGRIPGLFMQQNTGEPGIDDYNIYVRGNTGGYITLINGVERTLTPYDLEQIEEIRVLKDPVSKALYGGVMCNGIILVTTKTGKTISKNDFRVNLQQGWKTPTVLPKYLNSYDFAKMYNQALDNDGILTGSYIDEALTAYRDRSKPIQYPDVDFYGQFLNDWMHMTRANAEYYGGAERTVFYLFGGFRKEGGLEAFGNKKTDVNAFNLQGNIITHYSDFITLKANITGYYRNKQYPGAGTNFSEFSSRRPNAYPIFVDAEQTKVGGVSGMLANPYAVQVLNGYSRENAFMVQGDIGLTFQLNKLINGLSFTPLYTFDMYNQQTITKIDRPEILGVSNFDASGNPGTITTLQTGQKAISQSLGSGQLINRWAFSGILSWAEKFDDHEINLDGLFYISREWLSGQLNDYKRQNNALRANYTYSRRYTVEGALVYSGSVNYAPGKRFKAFPALGASWLLSEESFMKNISPISFLKLNASWGIQGDGKISSNLWRESWATGGTYTFNNTSSSITSYLSRMPNYELNWPKMRQMDISLEAVLFKKISGKFSWFDYLQYDLISQRQNTLPSIVGSPNNYPQQNYGKTDLKGVETELRYFDVFGKLKLNIGGHFTYSKSNRIHIDELPDPLYTNVGTPVDAIRGYRTDGFYTQNEINQIREGVSNLALPSYMDPKSLRVGDIKYKNLNNDELLDKYDTEIIGNSSPRIMYGLDVSLKYNGFELFMLLTGYGAYNRLLDNTYYQIYSTRKYSNVLIDGLPNGNPHPAISTSTATNDMQTSDYWIVDGSYLKLKNVALSYSIPAATIKHLNMSNLKITLYGCNLLTFSKIKDSDPESLNAGVTMFPLFRTVSVGLSAEF